MTISVVVVTFNSAAELESCFAQLPDDVELIVIDQGSADGTVDEVRRLRTDAQVVVAEENRGFGAGCNLGAQRARGEVLVFLNPDVQVSGEALRRLGYAVKARHGALVGPTIFDEHGHRVTRSRRWSSPLRDLFSLLVPRAGETRWGEDIPPDDPVYVRGGGVPFVQGACMAIGAAAFADAGGFDERYFLYGEEEVIARRMLARGRVAYLEPRAEVVHVGQASTTQVSSFAVRQLYRSRALMYEDRYGRWLGVLSSAALAGGLTLLLVTAPIRLLLGYRSTATAGWCLLALSGLAAGVAGRTVTPPTRRRP